jgi:hypothetical protein
MIRHQAPREDSKLEVRRDLLCRLDPVLAQQRVVEDHLPTCDSNVHVVVTERYEISIFTRHLFLQARGRDEKNLPLSVEHVKLCAE